MFSLFRFLKPYRMFIAAALTLMFIQVMADLYLPTLMAEIVNHGIADGKTSFILKTGLLMLFVSLGGILCAATAGFMSARTAMAFSKTLRGELFSHATDFSISEFDKIGASSMITRTTNDVMQVQSALSIMMSMMVRAPIMVIGGLIMATTRNLGLSVVFGVAVPLLSVFIFIVAKKAMPLFGLQQKKIDRINMVTREKLSGMRVIRAFNTEQSEATRFDDANKSLTETAIKLAKLMSFVLPAAMLLMNLTAVAIVWFGGLRVLGGTIQVGDVMAFIQYSMMVFFAIMMLSMVFIMLPRAQVSATRINEVLDTVFEIKNAADSSNPDINNGTVEFKNVSFKYQGAEEPALSNISFSAKPGEVTAIVGSTGSGKTTLVNLIARFYDVSEGSVIVNGKDIRQVPQEALRSIIGFVPQKSVLFSGTIESNIRFGNANAQVNDIKKAAEIAQAEEFINTREGGYDSRVEQSGSNLSGGQKQRLSIARAIARKPRIYIFDDSFSALDFRTDAALRFALKKETNNAAVFIVAQRAATVMDADRILVLEDGEMVGIGKHAELMKTCAVYKEIVLSQFSEEELA